MGATKARLLLAFHLIGWEAGARFLIWTLLAEFRFGHWRLILDLIRPITDRSEAKSTQSHIIFKILYQSG